MTVTCDTKNLSCSGKSDAAICVLVCVLLLREQRRVRMRSPHGSPRAGHRGTTYSAARRRATTRYGDPSMSTRESDGTTAGPRPWVEPTLTRHESMTALTRHQDVPVPGPGEVDDPAADSMMRALAVPGSQGFFP